MFLCEKPTQLLGEINWNRSKFPIKVGNATVVTEPIPHTALSDLSKIIPAGSNIYLGNSLPIREWDASATRAHRRFEVAANRGANGIDGQISTFLGWSEPEKENWGIFGDLTTLYDLAGPWILEQIPEETVLRIVVMNNGGGKIFAKLYGKPILENRHSFGFEHFARLWKLEYQRWAKDEDFPKLASNRVVIERIET